MIKGERKRQRGRGGEGHTWGEERGKSGPLSGAGCSSLYLRCAPAGSVCFVHGGQSKPPTTVHLDTLGTWRLITHVLKCSCLVSQRFVRTALCSGTKPEFHTFEA